MKFTSLFARSVRQHTLLWVAAGAAVFVGLAVVAWHARDDLRNTASAVLNWAGLETTTPAMRQMIADLETKANESSDADTLLRLGQAYRGAGRAEDARALYAQALKRSPDNTKVLSEYGWSLYEHESTNDPSSTRTVYERLHQLDSSNRQALSYLSMDAVQRRDYDGALAHWQQLLQQLPPDSPLAADIRKAIAKTQELNKHRAAN